MPASVIRVLVGEKSAAIVERLTQSWKKPDDVAFRSQRRSGPLAYREGPETSAAARRSAIEEGRERSGVTRRGVDHRLGHGAVARHGSGPARGRSRRHQILAP